MLLAAYIFLSPLLQLSQRDAILSPLDLHVDSVFCESSICFLLSPSLLNVTIRSTQLHALMCSVRKDLDRQTEVTFSDSVPPPPSLSLQCPLCLPQFTHSRQTVSSSPGACYATGRPAHLICSWGREEDRTGSCGLGQSEITEAAKVTTKRTDFYEVLPLRHCWQGCHVLFYSEKGDQERLLQTETNGEKKFPKGNQIMSISVNQGFLKGTKLGFLSNHLATLTVGQSSQKFSLHNHLSSLSQTNFVYM